MRRSGPPIVPTLLTAIALAVMLSGFLSGCATTGTIETALIPDQHDRPIRTENGRTLLWARDVDDDDPEWFDMTGSTIDPVEFQFGIGKDTIASIDEPRFAAAGDARLAERGVTGEPRGRQRRDRRQALCSAVVTARRPGCRVHP